MEDLPAKREQALADAGTPPDRSGSVNMWCLQFDQGANLPAPGQCLPQHVDLSATSLQQRVGGGSGGGAAAAGGKAR
jgi:hypothetical protein